MPVVASRNLVAIDKNGRAATLRLAIGQPYRVAESEWACPVELEGLYEHLWDQRGVDSFHALMLAQQYARTLLNDFVARGGRLLDGPGGAPIDVAQLFLISPDP